MKENNLLADAMKFIGNSFIIVLLSIFFNQVMKRRRKVMGMGMGMGRNNFQRMKMTWNLLGNGWNCPNPFMKAWWMSVRLNLKRNRKLSKSNWQIVSWSLETFNLKMVGFFLKLPLFRSRTFFSN